MINKAKFFTAVKQLGLFSTLTASQVKGMEAILDWWVIKKYTDLRWLAYMLATVYHETAKTMMPIEEYGKGKGRPYGKKIKNSGVPYTIPNQLYYGRGFVQLTWFENYQLMGRLLKVDLLNHPELALDLATSTRILFEGMTKGSSSFGDFTGKCLEMYFNDSKEDSINARRIINGTDKAGLIASHYEKFKSALK